jgi:hypothetical protein
MYKKFGLLLLIVAMLALSSCNTSRTVTVSKGKTSSQSSTDGVSSASSKSSQTSVLPLDNEISTTKNYKVNDQIPIGKNADIIIKQGIFKQNVPAFKGKSYYDSDVFFLGADSNCNLIIDEYESGEIDSVDSGNKVTTVINYMQNRKNHVYDMGMCGNIIAWSECPHGNEDPATDTTNGAGWELYFADLTTEKITKIDGYKKIAVPNGAQYGYLAPSQVNVSPDHIAYVSWDYVSDGSVKPVIKLYTISTKKLEILDYLAEDVRNHALGYPYVSGDKAVWCKGKVNEDGTYTGFSILYDITTKARSKLVTDENIINPLISGDYIFASGQPNKTFYDLEICVYDIAKNQWVYKVNNSYSQYKNIENDYLTDLESTGGYLVWNTGDCSSLVIFNKADNKLYNIVPLSDKRYISGPRLLDGNLLVWYDRPFSSQGCGAGTYKYVVLK